VTRTPLRRLFDHREKLLTLSLIVGIAWLRWRLLGYTEMWEDQALTLNAALEWVHGGALPLASMKSSFGVFNPPLVLYLYALPLFFSTDVLGVVWMVALVNLAGVFGLGWAARRVYDGRAAWWAALLLAVNPWAVYYGRLIWMQSFVPGFAALTLACGLMYFGHAPRGRYALGGALALAATIQVHLTAVALLPVLLLAAFLFRRQVRAAHLLGAGALFSLTWLPFLLFEIRNNFVDWQALRAGLALPAQVSSAALLILMDLLHGRGSLATLFLPAGQWAALEGLPITWLVEVVFGVAVAAAAVNVWRGGRERELSGERRADLILLLWTILPILFYLRHNQYLQNYYLLYVLPAPLVLMARLGAQVYAALKAKWAAAGQPWLRWAPLAAFAPLVLIAAQQARMDLLGQNRLAAGEAGHQRVMDVRAAIAWSNRLLAERPGCALVVMSNGPQYEASRLALLREFTRASGEAPPRTRFVSATEGRLIPAPCALYLISEPDADALAWLAEIAEPLPAATVQTPTQNWQFFDLNGPARAGAVAELSAREPLGVWTNDLALRAAGVGGAVEPGGWLEVKLVWTVEQPAPPRFVHFGIYVLDQSPKLVAQADGPGVDSTEWRQGDLFETTFALQLPADLASGEFDVATALYYYPEIQRLPLAGSAADLLYWARISF
jgi:hypothetical protein